MINDKLKDTTGTIDKLRNLFINIERQWKICPIRNLISFLSSYHTNTLDNSADLSPLLFLLLRDLEAFGISAEAAAAAAPSILGCLAAGGEQSSPEFFLLFLPCFLALAVDSCCFLKSTYEQP